MRRRFGLGLVLGTILLGLAAGCNNIPNSSRFSTMRPGSSGVLGHEVVAGGSQASDDSPISDEERRAVMRQHKPNRLSGAWSDEAAEIEASLGVPR